MTTEQQKEKRATRLTAASCARAQEIIDLIDHQWPGQSELNHESLFIGAMSAIALQGMPIETSIQMLLDIHGAAEQQSGNVAKTLVLDYLFGKLSGLRKSRRTVQEEAKEKVKEAEERLKAEV